MTQDTPSISMSQMHLY